MSIQASFYKGRAALNVLARDVDNARTVYDAAEGHVLVGVLSKDYPTVQAAVDGMQTYGQAINHHVSVGLGQAIIAKHMLSLILPSIMAVVISIKCFRRLVRPGLIWLKKGAGLMLWYLPQVIPVMSMFPQVRKVRDREIKRSSLLDRQ